MARRLAFRGALIAVALALVTPAPGSAQYFGQNKVQYERFGYQVLRTESFDIYHYPEEADAVRIAAPLAEQWRNRLTRDLGFGLRGRQPLVLYASHPHFSQTQVIEGLIGEGTGGVTEYLKRRMVLPFASSLGETSHVLGHELVHAFQYDAGSERALALPLWFIEGMAEFLTLGDDNAHTAMWLRDLADDETLPAFEDLAQPRYFPYRVGHAAWAYLASRFGVPVVGRAYVAAARSGDPIAGIEEATGVGIDELTAGWHAAIRERHGPRRGSSPGRTLIAGDSRRGGTMNVSPALSPDGRWIAYLSERSQFSIELYLAEAGTGRGVRRLTRTDSDPHFESLQFVGSAGAWDRASRRLAFIGLSGGKPVLTVIDIGADGKQSDTREWPLPDVDEAWHPTWSPDGAQVAFSGLRGGLSDLYVFDLGSATSRRLTHDPYADRQPAWSPDGRQLAFVTDRFSPGAGGAAASAGGDDRLALLTVSSGQIVPLSIAGPGKQINPQWHGRGDRLSFIADPDGIANVFQVELTSGAVSRLTDVDTGVTGLTASSPALSVALDADRLAISVFQNGGYAIHLVEPVTPRRGAAEDRTAARLFGATDDVGGPLAVALPARGLGATTTLAGTVEPYRPALSLDFAGASGGVGMTSRYGAFVGGGVGLLFSDMVGHHALGAIIEANGGVRDIGAQLTYLNRESRWNWGGSAMVRPYVTGGMTQQLTQVDGQVVLLNDEVVFRQTDADLRALAFYPFSRAFRFELQGGGRRIWFDRSRTTRLFSPTSGQLLGEEQQDLAAPGALNLAESAAALVYDQSVFGPTSPIAGQRHRVEVAPTFGSLTFTTATIDLRRYLALPAPFSIALRGLHVGRYGRDAEDARLSPLFIGYPSLVRGYDYGSFDERDCGTTASGACPAFDALIGSRVAVGNAELRFPLFGALSGQYHYGPLPFEAFVFADAGVAWTSTLDPDFAGGDRRFVRSVGAGARVNVFGYLIGEVAMARPLDRPGRGWLFTFNLMPGY